MRPGDEPGCSGPRAAAVAVEVLRPMGLVERGLPDAAHAGRFDTVAVRQTDAIRHASQASTARSIRINLGLCLAGAPVSTLLDELSKKAQALAVEERAQLAQELLESVERDADPDVQAAWEAEIASRIAKYERGEAKLIPAEEVFAAARRLTQ